MQQPRLASTCLSCSAQSSRCRLGGLGPAALGLCHAHLKCPRSLFPLVQGLVLVRAQAWHTALPT